MEQMDRDFRLLENPHFYEVSFVVEDLEKSLEQFRTLFNMTPYVIRDDKIRDFELHGKTVPEARIKFALFRAGPIRLELLQPVEGESIWMECLREKGTGVHGIVCRVSDLDSELTQLQERGIGVSQRIDVPRANLKFAFLETEDIAGVCIELAQSEGMPGE